MGANLAAIRGCVGRTGCDYYVSGGAGCTETGNSCSNGRLLSAEPSIFHDGLLIEATNRINEILDALPEDPEGRTVSFINTRMGTLLAWVSHGATVAPPGAVTNADDNATIARALKLTDYNAAGAGQA